MSKNFQSEAFISREDGKLVQVMPDTSKEYEKGYGYLHGDYVYIYRALSSPDHQDQLAEPSCPSLPDMHQWMPLMLS